MDFKTLQLVEYGLKCYCELANENVNYELIIKSKDDLFTANSFQKIDDVYAPVKFTKLNEDLAARYETETITLNDDSPFYKIRKFIYDLSENSLGFINNDLLKRPDVVISYLIDKANELAEEHTKEYLKTFHNYKSLKYNFEADLVFVSENETFEIKSVKIKP